MACWMEEGDRTVLSSPDGEALMLGCPKEEKSYFPGRADPVKISRNPHATVQFQESSGR